MWEPTCLDCKKVVRAKDPNVLAEVTGFAKQRQGGGQNHVRFRRGTGRYLCPTCAAKRQYGSSSEQGALFG